LYHYYHSIISKSSIAEALLPNTFAIDANSTGLLKDLDLEKGNIAFLIRPIWIMLNIPNGALKSLILKSDKKEN
jgi:hypothetical protein